MTWRAWHLLLFQEAILHHKVRNHGHLGKFNSWDQKALNFKHTFLYVKKNFSKNVIKEQTCVGKIILLFCCNVTCQKNHLTPNLQILKHANLQIRVAS